MLFNSLSASGNISWDAIREIGHFFLPAAGFLLGWLLTVLIYRASERAKVARLEERLAAAKEAKNGATERLALLQRELDSARANESRLLRQQGQLEGQLRAGQRLLEDLGLGGSSLPPSEATTEPIEIIDPGFKDLEEDAFVPEKSLESEALPTQAVFSDAAKSGFAVKEDSAPRSEKREPQTLEEYLAQDSMPIESFEGYEGSTASPNVKGAAAELRAALENRDK